MKAQPLKKEFTYYNISASACFLYLQISFVLIAGTSANSASDIHTEYFFWCLRPIIGLIPLLHILLIKHIKFYETYFTSYKLFGKRTDKIPYENVVKYNVIDTKDRNGTLYKNLYFETIDNQQFEISEGALINKKEVACIQKLVAQKAKIDTALGKQMENWGSIKMGLILISFGLVLCSLNYYVSKDMLNWTPHSANDIETMQGTVTYSNKQYLGKGSYIYDFSLKEYPNFIFRIGNAMSSILSQDSSLPPIEVSDVMQIGINKKDYNIKIAHTQAQDWWNYIYKYEYIDIYTITVANRSYIELATYDKYNIEYPSPSVIGFLWIFEKLLLIQGIGTVLFQCFSIFRGNKKVSVV
jgi:hypothetical protein